MASIESLRQAPSRGAAEGGEGVEGFRVVTAVGEKRVGRIVGAEGDYYIIKRSFGRGR
jgi:hypothetical protein